MSIQEQNIFEQATRQRLRFKGANGMLSTEDLWSLALPRLDEIAKGLRKELRESEDSFIAESKTNSVTELMFAVVKHVIEVKLEERDEKAKAKARAAERERLMVALERKQTEKLENASEEEIKKRLAELGDA